MLSFTLPAFAADERLAFVLKSGFSAIYTANPDGTGLVRLTNDALRETGLRWSPDGSSLGYLQEAVTSQTDIEYVLNIVSEDRSSRVLARGRILSHGQWPP